MSGRVTSGSSATSSSGLCSSPTPTPSPRRGLTSPGAPRGQALSPTLEDTDRHRLVDALERTAWNITRTAAMLGVTRNTIRARMRLYGLRPAGSRAAEATPPPAAAAASDVTPASADRAEPAMIADVRWERRRVTFLRARILAAAGTSSLLR